MIRLPFVVAFGLWQKCRLEDLLREMPDYYGEEDAVEKDR